MIHFMVAATLALSGVAAPLSGVAAPQHPGVRVLQLNLCNSGMAPCWDDKPGSDATRAPQTIQKASQVFASLNPRPSVVVMNEVCSDDLKGLKQRLNLKGDTFFPALNGSDPHKCGGKRPGGGGEYGTAILTAEELPEPWDDYKKYVVYRDQDPGEAEKRIMGCRNMKSFTVCGSHLGVVANEAQCTQLLHTANTWASRGPLIISGDMNLRWNNADEQQKLKNCMRNVPGFTRKSDGKRQHVFTRNGGWGFPSTNPTGTVSMGTWSDHDAFWADLRP